MAAAVQEVEDPWLTSAHAPCLALQPINHQERFALATTREEFINFLGRAQDAFWRLLEQPANVAKWVTALGAAPAGFIRQVFEEGKAAGPGVSCPVPMWFPMWSFDNPGIHGGKGGKPWNDFVSMANLRATEIFDLPVRSSDIHKVIEHTHARLVKSFYKVYDSNLQSTPISFYKDVLRNHFYTNPWVASAKVIRGDVESLRATLHKIVEKKGGEIPKPMR